MPNKSATVTGIKLSIACALAFSLYTFFHWPYGYWSVVSVAAVARPGLSFTLIKAIMRIIGTIAGALLAFLIAWVSKGNTIVITILFFASVFISSYISLHKSLMRYCGVIFGITIVLVLATTLMTHQLFGIAVDRTIEVLVGILCVLTINLLLRLFFSKKEDIKGDLTQEVYLGWKNASNLKNKKSVFIACLRIAVAAGVTFVPWLIFRYSGGYWATVSCLLIMEENPVNVNVQGFMLFLSHIIIGVVAVIIAYIIGDNVWFLLIPLIIVYFILGYLMVTSSVLSNSCSSMGIAFAIMLLMNPGSTFEVILSRFLNVMGGIGVGLLISHFFLRKRSIREERSET